MLKAVIFDLDGTLLDREASVVRFVIRQHQRYKALHPISVETYIRSFVALDDGGMVWKDKVYQQLLAEHEIKGVSWKELLQDYLKSFAQDCVGFEGMEAMLAALKGEGYVLGMVTNGRSPFQEGNIRALGIENYFSTIVVSDAVGMRKPEPEIFLETLGRLKVTADEAAFVGDSPKSDIWGAQGVGMKAIWKRNARWGECEEADGVCDHMSQLPALIRSL